MEITNLRPEDEAAIAEIVVEAFRGHTPAWPDTAAALEEVQESFAADRLSRVAREGERVLGWIGGIRQYDGNVWELHPLAVDPARQREGIGGALVADLEREVAIRTRSTAPVGLCWRGSSRMQTAPESRTSSWRSESAER